MMVASHASITLLYGVIINFLDEETEPVVDHLLILGKTQMKKILCLYAPFSM